MFKLTIYVEMTTGHKFTDVIYRDEFSNEFIENYIAGKAHLKGFKFSEVQDYKVVIINTI